MGDRAMAEIKVTDGSLYFYTHWAGSRLPRLAQDALDKAQKRVKMLDDAYSLKIVLDSLINSSGARDSETGAGTMFSPDAEDEYNNDSPSVVIDLVNNTVEVHRVNP